MDWLASGSVLSTVLHLYGWKFGVLLCPFGFGEILINCLRSCGQFFAHGFCCWHGLVQVWLFSFLFLGNTASVYVLSVCMYIFLCVVIDVMCCIGLCSSFHIGLLQSFIWFSMGGSLCSWAWLLLDEYWRLQQNWNFSLLTQKNLFALLLLLLFFNANVALFTLKMCFGFFVLIVDQQQFAC